MRVEVTLDNRCELIDDAFMVVTEPDGARATFERGLAALQTRSGSRVYLKANDKYPGFEFESPRKVAQPKMVLTAECGTGERIERTIDAMREEIVDRYGPLPKPVETLLEVARLRVAARAAGLHEVVLVGSNVRFAPVDLAESATLRLGRLYPRSTIKPATRTMLVPRPQAAAIGGEAPRDVELLDWVRGVISAISTPITTNVSG